MRNQEDENYETIENSVYKTRWQISDLPDLTDEDTERSLHHTAREWVFEFSAPTNLGKYIHIWRF